MVISKGSTSLLFHRSITRSTQFTQAGAQITSCENCRAFSLSRSGQLQKAGASLQWPWLKGASWPQVCNDYFRPELGYPHATRNVWEMLRQERKLPLCGENAAPPTGFSLRPHTVCALPGLQLSPLTRPENIRAWEDPGNQTRQRGWELRGRLAS